LVVLRLLNFIRKHAASIILQDGIDLMHSQRARAEAAKPFRDGGEKRDNFQAEAPDDQGATCASGRFEA
jgi:hypothetical protein